VEGLHRLEDFVFQGFDAPSKGNSFPTFRKSSLPLYSLHSSGD